VLPVLDEVSQPGKHAVLALKWKAEKNRTHTDPNRILLLRSSVTKVI